MVGWTAAGWGIPQQYYFPPKQPRRPDPNYWQTQLTDNGLGLENMHIKYAFSFSF